jgi:hypothetical protein
MRYTLFGLLVLLSVCLLAGCADDAARPQPVNHDLVGKGEIDDADFELEIVGGEPGDPFYGPFLLTGSNLHYDDDAGALVVDLRVRNMGSFPHREPIGLTFIQLDPDGVTVLNPDNDIHGDGAAIVFPFANDDAIWTPGEGSLPRTVQFDVDEGTAIAFVVRLDIGDPIEGGTIAGRVWHDANENGVMEDGEHGIPGESLHLYSFSDDGDSTVTREFAFAQTDADGRYAFHHLRAGAYVVDRRSVANDCRPTTANQIHVLLVEVDGDVSSYRNANFGCIPLWTPPIIGKYVRIVGTFSSPDRFDAAAAETVECPEDSVPLPVDPPGSDCIHAVLRGEVTGIAPERNAFRVMATWIIAEGNFPDGLRVGERVDVLAAPGPGLLGWMLAWIGPWTQRYDELGGRVDAVEPGPDGRMRWHVLDTWVTPPPINDP